MKIYDKEGIIIAEVNKFQYQGTFMEESFLSFDIDSPVPIDFKVGDNAEYRGEKYILNSTASIKKNSSPKSIGNAFRYEGLKFDSLAHELKVCDFLDYVLNDNNVHFSSLPNFSFFAASIQDLANRIQANLDRIYTGESKWTIIVQSQFVKIENVNIEVSNVKVWEALQLSNTKFKTNFIIKGRTITIGTDGIEASHIFKYGQGNGLYKLQRTSDQRQEIITRLRAYGSTRNLPSRYYNILIDPIIEAPILSIKYDPAALIAHITFGFSPVSLSSNRQIEVSINEKSYTLYASGNREVYLPASNESEIKDINIDTIVRFTSGININKVPSKYKIASGEVVPNNMAIQNLMLPDFPKITLDPYIDSDNVATLGLKEGSVFFDGSGDLEEIFPSLEGMTSEQLEAAGISVSLDSGDNGKLDEVARAEQITDNGLFDENDTIPPFKIYLKDIGFDINDYISSEAPVISMKSGMCGGRDFEILLGSNKPHKEGNKWVITCNRSEDTGLGKYFPNENYQIRSRDKFVLLNIEMPGIYVEAASQRLLQAAQEYLSKKDYILYSYEPTVDEVYMARQHLDAKAKGDISLYETIKEGAQMRIRDDDVGIDGGLLINQITIKEGEGLIPKYTITLRQEKIINYGIPGISDGFKVELSELKKKVAAESAKAATKSDIFNIQKSVSGIENDVSGLNTSLSEIEQNTYSKKEVDSKFEVKGQLEGEWIEGKEYKRNNRVQYRGCMYLCVVDSTFSKPGYYSEDWILEQGNPDFVMEILSLGGDVFIGNNVDTDLVAEVQIYNQDITSNIPAAQWTWTRASSYKESDIIWNAAHVGTGNSVHITLKDLPGIGQRVITFTCTAFVDNNNKVTQKILI